ncbi:MAG: CoA-binding protein, partial [Nitrospinota bacterium]|nr:CoA-binding protein [Nitrospinota bacterium]
MNILGGESSKVTPISHEYSGGNVVAGVQYGRPGQLETKNGNIPVYGGVKEVCKNHEFDTGVVYLPPTAVYYAVAELLDNNRNLKTIVIITEKISVKDSRMLRAICQYEKVDVIGANSLGIANAWDRVRVGGALGGSHPAESLKKGSIAIHSNSGNFCTTISEYLKTAGFGLSTVVSSGKDIYIHFALPEFLYCAENDPRTKAVVLYIEPGGYYEKLALDWIKEGKYKFKKPIVACITGRWKRNITRACGHAGALGGSGEDAIAKEEWFDEYFGMGEYNPQKPKVSKKGVRVSSIQYIPEALKLVMRKNGVSSDFKPIGDLSLKPWFANDMGLKPPKKLIIPVVKAIKPYSDEIEIINKQTGASYLRDSMRNKSGASKMDRKTQITELHRRSILDLTKYSFETNIFFALTKTTLKKDQQKLFNILLNYFTTLNSEILLPVVTQGKVNDCAPNAYLSSVIALLGNNAMFKNLKDITGKLISSFSENGLSDINSRHFDVNGTATKLTNILGTKRQGKENEVVSLLLSELKALKVKNCIDKTTIKVLDDLKTKKKSLKCELEFLVSSILLSLGWDALIAKRISRQTAESLATHFAIQASMVGLSVVKPDENVYWKNLVSLANIKLLKKSFTETCFQVLFNRKPHSAELKEFNSLLALTITNGPGTISSKGAKESVSARNNISLAYVGFMANTGLAHGGNGFEAVQFLLEKFKGIKIDNPGNQKHKVNLKKIADKVAATYLEYKTRAKERGILNYDKIPCTNHPVFKDKKINLDPREEYISKQFSDGGIYNIFLDFYHKLVWSLYEVGASPKVFCVNIDAVIAVIALKLMWEQFASNKITKKEMSEIVFLIFLFARMVGVSAEIADHLDRGTDMDCRTPASECVFVS